MNKLLFVVLFSSVITSVLGVSFNLDGTVSAVGYGDFSFQGTGTLSLNSFKDSVSITTSNETGFFYWTNFFGTWDVQVINDTTVSYYGSGTFKTAGENISMRVSRSKSISSRTLVPKTRLLASGSGFLELTGDGSYSISRRVHGVSLEVFAPQSVPLSQPFNATVSLRNNGDFDETVPIEFEFNYVGPFQGCSNTFGTLDVFVPKKISVASVNASVELTAVCNGPYEFKARAVNIDARPGDNFDSTLVNNQEFFVHDLAITEILVPDSVLIGEEFTPKVEVVNKGNFTEQARLGTMINPITNHSCPLVNLPLSEFSLLPGEVIVYAYEPLSFDCAATYGVNTNLLNSDDFPEDNWLSTTFDVVPPESLDLKSSSLPPLRSPSPAPSLQHSATTSNGFDNQLLAPLNPFLPSLSRSFAILQTRKPAKK